MVFHTVRDLRNNAKLVQETISNNGEAVITNNGKPWALMIEVDDDNLLETIRIHRAARAAKAIAEGTEDAASSMNADIATTDEAIAASTPPLHAQQTSAGVIDQRSGEVFPSHKARRKAVLKRLDTFHETQGKVTAALGDINRMLEEDYDGNAERIVACLS